MISSFFWDPNPNIFIIPYLNHPLKWYGLFFMGGIVSGFFLLYLLLKEKLQYTQCLRERDISSWQNLSQALLQFKKTPDHPLSAQSLHLDKNIYQQLSHQTALSDTSKQQILSALSTLLTPSASSLDRLKLEELLPTAITPLRELSYNYVDRLIWWFVLGTVVGARLGHVLFYNWSYYQNHLIEILKIWEGGLASHGGTVGILIAIYYYTRRTKRQFPELDFLSLLDLLAIPVSFGVIFIRIGNFVNQEILGTASSLPWSVTFGHPLDGEPAISRHPVQLYEAAAYFLTFILLTTLWKLRKGQWGKGFMVGLLFVCVYGSRFFLEFFKAPQGTSIPLDGFLEMGQLLSLPFIILGVALIYFSQTRSNHDCIERQSEH